MAVYEKALVGADRRARAVTGNPIVRAGESVFTPELLEFWRAWFKLPAQASQVAIYARLGVVADLASDRKDVR